MADYRSFCGSCGNEVGFGSHKKDCEAMARVKIADDERRAWERSMRQALAELSDDDIVAAMVEYERRADALGQEQSAVERHLAAVREAMMLRSGGHDLIDRARKELGYRGLRR
jgi:DNA-binding transcriptional ArsR family regulator